MASPPYSSLCGDRASPLGSLLSRGSHGLLKWPASMFNVSDIVSHVCCPVCCLLPLEEQITTRSFSYSPLLCGPLTGLAVLTVSFQTDAGLQSQVVMAWHTRLSHGSAFFPSGALSCPVLPRGRCLTAVKDSRCASICHSSSRPAGL